MHTRLLRRCCNIVFHHIYNGYQAHNLSTLIAKLNVRLNLTFSKTKLNYRNTQESSKVKQFSIFNFETETQTVCMTSQKEDRVLASGEVGVSWNLTQSVNEYVSSSLSLLTITQGKYNHMHPRLVKALGQMLPQTTKKQMVSRR